MPELLAIMDGATPGAYGIWTLVLMIAGWFLKEWRENRKLSSADKLAKREGYAAQVQLLMNENRKLLADMHALRLEYDKHRKQCYAETEELRRMINVLQEDIDGLKAHAGEDALEILRLKESRPAGHEEALRSPPDCRA